MFKNQILFFSLIGRETILVVCGLQISCHISSRLGADEESFCEDEFSFVLVEAQTNFNHNSLRAECCSGEDA